MSAQIAAVETNREVECASEDPGTQKHDGLLKEPLSGGRTANNCDGSCGGSLLKQDRYPARGTAPSNGESVIMRSAHGGCR